jgi:phospholipase/carboxylesterase
MTLQGPVFKPLSAEAPKSLLVLLHGLGADGADLIELAPHLAKSLPETLFIAPDAPFPCDMAPFGRQWFSLQSRDEKDILSGIETVAPVLVESIVNWSEQYKIPMEKIALLGFSQGAMLSLHFGLRFKQPLAGILAYSGALIAPYLLKNLPLQKQTPICLIHGEDDEVVPFVAFNEALSSLQKLNFPVEGYSRAGLGHGIDQAGIAIGTKFLQGLL